MPENLKNKNDRKEYAVFAITKHGIRIAERILDEIPEADLYVSKKFAMDAPEGSFEMNLPMGPTLEETFFKYNCHIHIISVGAVVRMIKNLMRDKKVDPAIVCVDDASRFSICVLSGHVGRGNYYTEKVATILNAIPVISTASDSLGTLTVDILGRELGWELDDDSRNVTLGCAAVVNSAKVAFIQETGENNFWPLDKKLPECINYCTGLEDVNPDGYEMLLIVSDREFKITHPEYFNKSVIYRPKSIILGIGCDKDTPADIIENGVLHHLEQNKISIKSVKSIATIDIKKNESGIIALTEKYGWNLVTYPADVLDRVDGIENPSETVRKYTGSRTVAEGACLKLSGADKLLIPKQSYKEDHDVHNMTLAAARIPFPAREIDMKTFAV